MQNFCSINRVSNHLLYEDPSLFCLAPVFKFYPTPFPVASNFHPHCSFCCFVFWLNGWLHHIWCAILLNDIMDLNIYQKDPVVCLMQQDVKFTEVSDTQCGFLLVLWFNITHTYAQTNKDTAHSGATHELTHSYTHSQ